ncbi:serine acetyltransferase [Pseudoalteromonas sp. SG45-5]|uniref:serine O-acetyltransferase n=1 Tax=unclassified Pseudoalteromonas TaxID=194690 RepID=UPI0015F90B93|nr:MULTISPECIES: DapH/DapD/GlmU-related protein [unclassified Pseudoalteromonas]MBB1384767.1 serine acetyltransferase [Pseudoalteromonas sp. SG45-5]MBB1392582.1 serine acetyltransferase [Pseudoalteromonas sp. SG44-4]MBB1446941.1 serine acetyltransferase [Pseudoalteromonas sp. SG41-6]
MKLYHIGNYLHRHKIPLLPKAFNILIRLIHNSAIFSETSIGTNTVFAYGGIGVVIHKRSTIGKNCVIGSNVTIGGKSKSINVPVIGDNCFIATGAKILGEITIGNNCVIGANCVVVKNVPDNSVVAGIPGKIIKSDIDPKDYY